MTSLKHTGHADWDDYIDESHYKKAIMKSRIVSYKLCEDEDAD